jgi:hypothetical protein
MLSARSVGAENVRETIFQICLRFGVTTCFADAAPPWGITVADGEEQLSDADSTGTVTITEATTKRIGLLSGGCRYSFHVWLLRRLYSCCFDGLSLCTSRSETTLPTCVWHGATYRETYGHSDTVCKCWPCEVSCPITSQKQFVKFLLERDFSTV